MDPMTGESISPMPHHPCLSVRRLGFLVAACVFGAVAEASADDLKPTKDPARQLFGQYCQNCHEGTKHKGDFQIGSLSDDFADKANRERWFDRAGAAPDWQDATGREAAPTRRCGSSRGRMDRRAR